MADLVMRPLRLTTAEPRGALSKWLVLLAQEFKIAAEDAFTRRDTIELWLAAGPL